MAKTHILLISETEVKENSTIEKNVEPKLLNLILSDIQKNELKRIIGKTNYDGLLTAIVEFKETGTDLTERDKELIEDYIKPYLIAATVVQFIVLNNYKLTNKGVLSMTDEQAKDVNSGDLEYLKGYYIIKQESAKKSLREYIDAESNTCTNSTNTTDDFGGLYLEDTRSSRFYTGKNKYM